jgi:hypothetical protein
MPCIERETDADTDLWLCSEPSVEHADGTVECLSGDPCDLPHHLHDWVMTCADLDPPCPCPGAAGGGGSHAVGGGAPQRPVPDRGYRWAA